MRPYLRRDVMPAVTRYKYPINKFMGFDTTGNDDTTPFSYAKYGYNISFRNGVLKSGIGIGFARTDNYDLPNGLFQRPARAFLYYHYDYERKVRDDMLIVLFMSGTILGAHLSDQYFTQLDFSFPNGNATFLNYHYNNKDCMLAIGGDGTMYIYDGETATLVEGALPLTSSCVHYERVYGTMNDGNNRVYFSASMDPANWNVSLTEGGYLSFPDEGGKVQKVVSFKDNLYIFREYGIHKLTAYYDQTEFSLTKVYVGNNLIYPETIAVCGNKILFLMEDGLYTFDGFQVTKILRGLNDLIADKTNANACYFNDKYYLAAVVKKDQYVIGMEGGLGEVNNGIIVVDFDGNEVSVARGLDVKQFLPINFNHVNMLLTFHNGVHFMSIGMVTEDGKLFGSVLKKYWQSPYSNIENISSEKVLKRIYVAGKGLVTLSASLEKLYPNTLNLDGTKTIVVNKKADRMGISIESDDENFEVSGLILEFDLIRRRENE